MITQTMENSLCLIETNSIPIQYNEVMNCDSNFSMLILLSLLKLKGLKVEKIRVFFSIRKNAIVEAFISNADY